VEDEDEMSGQEGSKGSDNEGDGDENVANAERKPSTTSTHSSGLFISDPKSPTYPIYFPSPCSAEPSDVAEEIMDAVCCFSRRCNRDAAPLRLMLTGEHLDDEEVVEALKYAVEKGMGRVEEWGEKGLRVVVGARR
jgi:hypothetical protein